MRIDVALSPKEYMRALRSRRGSFLSFCAERFTGIAVGRFFSITHHAGYEINRRITNERNNAIGYIKKTPDGVQVRYWRTKGITTPQALLFWIPVNFLWFLLVCLKNGIYEPWLAVLCTLGLTLFVAAGSAFCDSLTERGEQGEMEVYALLYDPSDPLAYLDSLPRP
jgi:hypothetical protein